MESVDVVVVAVILILLMLFVLVTMSCLVFVQFKSMLSRRRRGRRKTTCFGCIETGRPQGGHVDSDEEEGRSDDDEEEMQELNRGPGAQCASINRNFRTALERGPPPWSNANPEYHQSPRQQPQWNPPPTPPIQMPTNQQIFAAARLAQTGGPAHVPAIPPPPFSNAHEDLALQRGLKAFGKGSAAFAVPLTPPR